VIPLPPALEDNIARIRRMVSDALRDAVVGPDADARRDQVMNTAGDRWFDESRPVRTVHSDASMFIGGMRALLLQTLHPLAMAGVAEHSDYRNDPWGRLQRTADFLAATSFGPEHIAQQAVDRVKAVHTRVTGTASDRRAYAANDPHLLRWVHVAEVDSFLRAHQEYGRNPLTPDECDAYVDDMALIASKLGVPAPPGSVRGLRDQIGMFRHELRSTPQSRDAVHWLLVEPPLDPAARIPYAVIAAAAVATLPMWARAELRIPKLPLVDELVARPAGALLARTFRWAMAVDGPVA